MTESDLVAFETMGKMEQTFPSLPGTEKARVFPILRTVRPSPDMGEFDMVREASHCKKILQDFCPSGTKTEVNINRHQLVTDRNSFASLMEEVEERKAIFPSGDSNKNSIAILDQAIAMDRFPHQTSNLFFPVRHNSNTRKAQRA